MIILAFLAATILAATTSSDSRGGLSEGWLLRRLIPEEAARALLERATPLLATLAIIYFEV